MSKFTPTNEQQLIVDNIAEGRNVAIQAGAGTGESRAQRARRVPPGRGDARG